MSSNKPINSSVAPSVAQPVIGIDASRVIGRRLTGTERYSERIVAGLLQLQPPEQIRLYVNSRESLPFALAGRSNVKQVSIPFPRLWTHLRLSAELALHPAGALFVPSHVVPPIHPRATVVTVHDLGYLYEPEAHPTWSRRYLDWSTRWSAFAATSVIAVSEATGRDLMDRYHVPSKKIVVIPHGVDDRFRAVGAESEADDARLAQLGIRPPYLLFLGTIQPRKNLARLIAAFDIVASDCPEFSLVLAGGIGWLAQSTLDAVERSPHRQHILLPGHVPDDHLPALYRGAAAAVFPSLYEGFGIPAAEAMASGTPVVASDRGALPEVVGDAGILVDPFDVDSIGYGIRQAIDPSTRARRIEAGMRRAATFRWDTAARQTLSVIRQAMSEVRTKR